MQLYTDIRENWQSPEDCDMYNKELKYCYSVSKPYAFCSHCVANKDRWQSKPRPKKFKSQRCLNFKINNQQCITCNFKMAGKGKSCYKKTRLPKHLMKEKRLRKKRQKDNLKRTGLEWTMERRKEQQEFIEKVKKKRGDSNGESEVFNGAL